MTNTSRKKPTILQSLRDRELMTTIFTLAWPTVTEQALQTIVQYADTAQVGRIGYSASAAVGLSSTTLWLVRSPLWALAMGVLACVSQALGAKDTGRVKRVASQSVLLTLISGTLLTVLTLAVAPFLPGWLGAEEAIRPAAGTYFAIVCAPTLFVASSIIFAAVLRATGDSKTPMRINILMNVINVLLNFLLINRPWTLRIGTLAIPVWGAGWGVTGAAIATAAAYVVGGTLMFLAALQSPELGLRGTKLQVDPPIMRRCLAISGPITAQRVFNELGHVVFTGLITHNLSTLAIATHTIAMTAEQAFYVPGFGMQAAAATLAGYSIGAKDEEKLGQYSEAIMAIAVFLMGTMSVFLFLFPRMFMGLFTPDQEVILLGADVLRIVAVSEPFFAVLIILEGVFNGVGDTKAPFVINMCTMWGVRIVFTYLCVVVFQLGLTAVWWCMVADNMGRFLAMLIRYRGRSWKRELYMDQELIG